MFGEYSDKFDTEDKKAIIEEFHQMHVQRLKNQLDNY